MKPCIDDCPAVSASRLRATGAIGKDQASVRVSIEGVEGLVRLRHRDFPNGGSWSFFECPQCSRRVRILRLHEGAIKCRYCTGLIYACQQGDKGPRIVRLQALLHGGAARSTGRDRGHRATERG
jgi:hypothetical protein